MKYIFVLLIGITSFSAYSQKPPKNPNAKNVCVPVKADPKYIHFRTSGVIRAQHDLGISYSMNHPSDSIYGFVNTKDFRKVLFIQAPVLTVVIYGLGEFDCKGTVEPHYVTNTKETVAYYEQGSEVLKVYYPKDQESEGELMQPLDDESENE